MRIFWHENELHISKWSRKHKSCVLSRKIKCRVFDTKNNSWHKTGFYIPKWINCLENLVLNRKNEFSTQKVIENFLISLYSSVKSRYCLKKLWICESKFWKNLNGEDHRKHPRGFEGTWSYQKFNKYSWINL